MPTPNVSTRAPASSTSTSGSPALPRAALVGRAWLAPHDENTGRPLSPGDAARSIAAVFRALERESWWRGVYWWKAFSDGRGARSDDRGYNLLGTPSEKAVAEGFARLAGEKRASR